MPELSISNEAGGSVEAALVQYLGARPARVLVCGSPGSDRLTPVGRLTQQLQAAGAAYAILSADPALPLFGIPGALNLGQWRDNWQLIDCEPLCSLDSSRFRLPLVSGLGRLLARHDPEALIVLAPGLARGVAGSELLQELMSCACIDTVLQIDQEKQPWPHAESLQRTGRRVFRVCAASSPASARQHRIAERSRLWREYMVNGQVLELCLTDMQVLGTPPPAQAVAAWDGRLVALFEKNRLTTLGEVVARRGELLQLRVGSQPGCPDQILLRDALVVDGVLQSALPYRKKEEPEPESPTVDFLKHDIPFTKKNSIGPVPVARVGSASACLVNGVFGDPLLKLQLLHRNRCLLFDLGDPGRLAARVAHQVSDVFFSHTHADHVGGFLWFLRSRIGTLPPCRCYGPPGLARQIAGMVDGILWDRVEDRAPRFHIREWHDDHLQCYHVVAGETGAQRQSDAPLADGVLWAEPGFSVRATRLDHRTPVLAYAWQPGLHIRVRRDALDALGLKPGAWLQALKQAVVEEKDREELTLPDGSVWSVAELRERLLLIKPGQKLVYATDFADTVENRQRLVALAGGAHSLFCESTFMLEHADQARRTQHLTTRACAEIANAAQVQHLLPFHFSKRYITRASAVYAEVRAHCANTVLPDFVRPDT